MLRAICNDAIQVRPFSIPRYPPPNTGWSFYCNKKPECPRQHIHVVVITVIAIVIVVVAEYMETIPPL